MEDPSRPRPSPSHGSFPSGDRMALLPIKRTQAQPPLCIKPPTAPQYPRPVCTTGRCCPEPPHTLCRGLLGEKGHAWGTVSACGDICTPVRGSGTKSADSDVPMESGRAGNCPRRDVPGRARLGGGDRPGCVAGSGRVIMAVGRGTELPTDGSKTARGVGFRRQ